MSPRLLHTSDLHLGSGFRGLSSAKRRERRDDLFKVFGKIAQTAKKEKVDAVLIVGDLFDASSPPTEVVDNTVEVLESLGDMPVIIVPGNHDPMGPRSVYKTASFPDNVTLATKTKFEPIEFPNFLLYAAAYDPRNPSLHPLRNLKISKSDKPVVVAVHGSYIRPEIKWKENFETEDYWPIDSGEKRSLKNVAYLALGHYHNFYTEEKKPYTCYPGTPEGVSFGEVGDRFVSLVTIDSSVSVEKICLNEKTYDVLEINCTKIADAREIEEKVEKKADENMLLKIKLKGVLSPDVGLNPDKLQEEFEDEFFHLAVAADVRPPKVLKFPPHTVKGIYVRMMRNRLKRAKTDRERRIIRKAIQYGLYALDDYL
jgi:DNA repair exonuclease SbcCD nuclease subunit